jgi:hypothetical protein
LRLPENFSTALLAILFATPSEQEGEDSALDLEIETASGRKRLRHVFQFGDARQVWMCADLCRLIHEPGGEPTDEDIHSYGGMKPDICCMDNDRMVFIENKTGGGRAAYQENAYLKFLTEKGRANRQVGFLYSVPYKWTTSPDNKWTQFIQEGDERVTRGLLRWDKGMSELIRQRVRLPEWFRDKLPDQY